MPSRYYSRLSPSGGMDIVDRELKFSIANCRFKESSDLIILALRSLEAQKEMPNVKHNVSPKCSHGIPLTRACEKCGPLPDITD